MPRFRILGSALAIALVFMAPAALAALSPETSADGALRATALVAEPPIQVANRDLRCFDEQYPHLRFLSFCSEDPDEPAERAAPPAADPRDGMREHKRKKYGKGGPKKKKNKKKKKAGNNEGGEPYGERPKNKKKGNNNEGSQSYGGPPKDKGKKNNTPRDPVPLEASQPVENPDSGGQQNNGQQGSNQP